MIKDLRAPRREGWIYYQPINIYVRLSASAGAHLSGLSRHVFNGPTNAWDPANVKSYCNITKAYLVALRQSRLDCLHSLLGTTYYNDRVDFLARLPRERVTCLLITI